jgi:hypothetical protein
VTTAASVLTWPEARIFVQLDEWASGGTIAASVDTPSSSRHPHDRGVESGVIRHGAAAQARESGRRRFPRGRCMTHCVRFGRSAGRDPGARSPRCAGPGFAILIGAVIIFYIAINVRIIKIVHRLPFEQSVTMIIVCYL